MAEEVRHRRGAEEAAGEEVRHRRGAAAAGEEEAWPEAAVAVGE